MWSAWRDSVVLLALHLTLPATRRQSGSCPVVRVNAFRDGLNADLFISDICVVVGSAWLYRSPSLIDF